MVCSTHMKWLIAGILTTGLLVVAMGAGLAHKGRLPEDALTLVRQASALLAQNPAMTGEVRERLEAALKSRKARGVRLEQVAEALRALERQDIAAARRLLMISIMPDGMPVPPASSGAATQMPAVPSPASPTPAPPRVQQLKPSSVDAAMAMAESLRVRFTGSRAEVAMLALALVLVGLGLTSLWSTREAMRR